MISLIGCTSCRYTEPVFLVQAEEVSEVHLACATSFSCPLSAELPQHATKKSKKSQFNFIPNVSANVYTKQNRDHL